MRKREKSMGKQERDVYGVEINTPPTCEAQAAGPGGGGNVVSVPENHLKTKIILLRPDGATVHSALRGSGPRSGHSQDPPGCGLASPAPPPPPCPPQLHPPGVLLGQLPLPLHVEHEVAPVDVLDDQEQPAGHTGWGHPRPERPRQAVTRPSNSGVSGWSPSALILMK